MAPFLSSISTVTCESTFPTLHSSTLHTHLILQRHLASQSLWRSSHHSSFHQPRHVLLPRPRRRPPRQRHEHPRRHPHHPFRAQRLRKRRLLRISDRRGARDRLHWYSGDYQENQGSRWNEEARVSKHRYRHLGSCLYVPSFLPSPPFSKTKKHLPLTCKNRTRCPGNRHP